MVNGETMNGPGLEGSDDEIVVVAAVLRREDRLLVCQRPHHKRHGGMWEFPGGKCEAGETMEDALRRELLEELGVRLVSWEQPLFRRGDEGSAFLIVFIPAEVEGEPRAIEHEELAWLTLSETAQVELAPSDRLFVEMLLQGGKSKQWEGVLPDSGTPGVEDEEHKQRAISEI